MNNIKQICDCGCGKEGHSNRMGIVQSEWQHGHTRRKGRVAWCVLKECAPAFERELVLCHGLENIVRLNVAAGFLRRLAVAAQVYDHQANIWERRLGPDRARRIARDTVLRWLLPQWLGLRLTQRGWLQEAPYIPAFRV